MMSRAVPAELGFHKCPRCGNRATAHWINASTHSGDSNTVTTFACGTQVLDWQLGDPQRYEVDYGSDCEKRTLWDHLR